MFPLLPLLILISNFNSIFPLKVDFNNNLNYYSQLLLNTNDVKDCINLENSIQEINNINKNIEKYRKSLNIQIIH